MLLALALSLATAGEGMWLPEQVPALGLDEQGLELAAEQLSDPLKHPLGAIVSLGFCSASFVSEDGLIATNHHCVTSFLQYLSDADNPVFATGYAAATRADEPTLGPTARVRVVEKLTDVTDVVLGKVGRRTSDAKRHQRIDEATKTLVAECEAQPGRRCYVAPQFGGSTYRLIQTLELQDLRMVYAPPDAVGQFGGDVDNWMWPRHSADFAFLRAYVAPDGSPAPYADDNVPYQPPHHLEVATEGVDEG